MLIAWCSAHSHLFTYCLPAILYSRTGTGIITTVPAFTGSKTAQTNKNGLTPPQFRYCGFSLNTLTVVESSVAIVIRVWCVADGMGSKRYGDNSISFGTLAIYANHIGCLCCLFRTSEETLAIILVLLHLRFPRFPHGPVLSKQPSELHPLFLLKGHVEMSESSCRSVLEAWEGEGGRGGRARNTYKVQGLLSTIHIRKNFFQLMTF